MLLLYVPMTKEKDTLRLTASEEQVMLRLWELGQATVTDLLALYPEPKPAYNTVSTLIRILERKKIVRHKPKGRGYIYTPKISKETYRDELAKHLITKYFDNNTEAVLSYYNKTKTLDDLLK